MKTNNYEEDELKFEDCSQCANIRKKSLCNRCDDGEEFQEIEPLGVDEVINLNIRGRRYDR